MKKATVILIISVLLASGIVGCKPAKKLGSAFATAGKSVAKAVVVAGKATGKAFKKVGKAFAKDKEISKETFEEEEEKVYYIYIVN